LVHPVFVPATWSLPLVAVSSPAFQSLEATVAV